MLLKVITLVSALIPILFFIFHIINHMIMIPVVFAVLWLSLVILCLVFCFIVTRFIDTKKVCKKHSPFYRFCSNFIIIDSVIQLLRIRLHVTGTEILPDEKFLLVGNHRSALDPLITMRVLSKYNMGFVAKKELFCIPIIGRLMHKCFCLSLNRENIREQVGTINQAIQLIKTQTASIGIYPEGTRNPTKELLPFMNGAFRIAKKAECQIVVAIIRNPEQAIRNIPLRKTDVYLDFIGVLDKDYVLQHTTLQIGDAVFNIMNDKMNKISSQFAF